MVIIAAKVRIDCIQRDFVAFLGNFDFDGIYAEKSLKTTPTQMKFTKNFTRTNKVLFFMTIRSLSS